MSKNTLKKHKSKKIWTTLLLFLGGIALILGSALGIVYSKFNQNNRGSLNSATNIDNKALALQFINQSTISCNAYSASETNHEYTVKDYVYFPSRANTYSGTNGFGFSTDESLRCEPTDWALANGAELQQYKETTVDETTTKEELVGLANKRSNGTSGWWTRSSLWPWYGSDDAVSIQDYGHGLMGLPTKTSMASRCVLQFNLKSVLSALNNGTAILNYNPAEKTELYRLTYNTITLYNLMYPQTIATSDERTALTSAFNSGTLQETGRKYIGKVKSIDSSSGAYTTCQKQNDGSNEYVVEYEYNKNYYVRVPEYSGTSRTYSDGTTGNANGTNYQWIKVEPITWAVPTSQESQYAKLENALTNNDSSNLSDSDSIEVFSLYGIVAGMYYFPTFVEGTYCNSWSSSCWRAYLNGYNLQNKSDPYMASTYKANFSDGYSFIDTIYHPILVAKPTLKSTSIPYTGNAINITDSEYCDGFDSTAMTATNSTQTEVGSYKTIISIDANKYQWEDGTTDDVELEWEITATTITKPTLKSSIAYTGNEISVLDYLDNFDADKMTVSGSVSKKNAGTYDVVIALKLISYMWEDKTTSPITLTWTIAKKEITTPTITSGTTADGTVVEGTTTETTTVFDFASATITPNVSGFDGTMMQVDGTVNSARAYTYYIIIYLKDEYKDNYVFANGRDFVILTWVINSHELTDKNTSIITGTN